jgi:hypothetical protein
MKLCPSEAIPVVQYVGGCVIRPKTDDLMKDLLLTPRDAPFAPALSRTPAENCARIKGLGYTVSKHIKMYGERFELVSDPFQEGDGIVVQVIGSNDPTIRTLQLPVSILLGLSDRGGHKTKFGKRLT